MAAAALLVGCSTDYQPIESRSPIVREGAYGTRKTVDGVDIWTFGEPSRKYQVLGIINDERLQAPFEMARYYHDVAAKVKQAGGNGAIEALSESQVTGIVSNSTTTSSGTVNAYGAGNAAVGRYSRLIEYNRICRCATTPFRQVHRREVSLTLTVAGAFPRTTADA